MIQDGMRDLTQQMQKKDGGTIPLQLRQAKVTAITGDTLTVTLDGTSITGVRKLASYAPTVNDTVWLFQNGGDLLVLDKVGPYTAGAMLDPRPTTVPPGDYPLGVSVMQVGSDGVANGWPLNYGAVITVHININRGWQEFVDKNYGRRFHRTAHSGMTDGWTAWQEVAVHTDSGWQAATLANGWTNYGSGFAPLQYRKIGGIVYVQGFLNGTAATSDNIAVIPAGYRPGLHLPYQATYTSSNTLARMDMLSTGTVRCTARTTWVGVMFTYPADQ